MSAIIVKFLDKAIRHIANSISIYKLEIIIRSSLLALFVGGRVEGLLLNWKLTEDHIILKTYLRMRAMAKHFVAILI